jgi:predicted O-methyltransferase YrrM
MREPLFGVWQALRDTVKKGESPIPAQAMDPTEVALARAFHNGAYATMMRVAEILDLEFSGYSRMVELGGHSGAGSLCLARRYPQIQATILDRAPFQSLAQEFIQATKLEDRVSFRVGNPDEGCPGEDADLVLLPHVLSRRSRTALPGILQAVRDSLRPGGAVIVTEFLLEDGKAEPREAALFRLNVVASYGPKNTGGLTRSELVGLLSDAGFTGVDMVGLPMFGITAITASRG